MWVQVTVRVRGPPIQSGFVSGAKSRPSRAFSLAWLTAGIPSPASRPPPHPPKPARSPAAQRPSADVSQRRRPLISHSLTSFPAALSPPFQQTLCSSKYRPAPAPGPPLRLSLLPGGLSVPLDAPLLLYTTSSWSPPHSGSPGHSIWTCSAPWPPSVLT